MIFRNFFAASLSLYDAEQDVVNCVLGVCRPPACRHASGATRPHAKQRECLLQSECKTPYTQNHSGEGVTSAGWPLLSQLALPLERRQRKKKGPTRKTRRFEDETMNMKMKQFPYIISTAFHVRPRLYFRLLTVVCSEQPSLAAFVYDPLSACVVSLLPQ